MRKIQFLLSAAVFIFFSSCEKKEDPKPDATSVSVTRIQVVSMPLTDGGNNWDLDGGADVFFTIINTSTTLYSHPTMYQDVTAMSLPLNYAIAGNGYMLPYINQAYGINLYDYDATSANDLIGQIVFNPNSYKAERPSSLSFTDGNVLVTVYFTWQ